MIHHVSIGVADIAASKTFYDAAMTPLGYSCLRSSATSLGYGKERTEFALKHSESPVPADPQSGLHFCFVAPTRASVHEFHAAGLANGGTDNGAPGLRADYSPTYYSAYLKDPDGYRLEVYCNSAA